MPVSTDLNISMVSNISKTGKSTTKYKIDSTMIEKERKLIEKIETKQKREIQQMVD